MCGGHAFTCALPTSTAAARVSANCGRYFLSVTKQRLSSDAVAMSSRSLIKRSASTPSGTCAPICNAMSLTLNGPARVKKRGSAMAENYSFTSMGLTFTSDNFLSIALTTSAVTSRPGLEMKTASRRTTSAALRSLAIIASSSSATFKIS